MPIRAAQDSAAQDSAAQDSAAQDSAAEDSAAEDSAAEDSAAQDSAEWDTADPGRAARVQARQERVADLLDARGLDAALLTDPANLAWVTCGADLSGGFGDDPPFGTPGGGGAVFLTHSSRVLLCGSADGPHHVDRELSGLGFQLKQRPWFEPPGELAADLCRGRTVGRDRPAPALQDPDPANLSGEFARWRATLDADERTAPRGTRRGRGARG